VHPTVDKTTGWQDDNGEYYNLAVLTVPRLRRASRRTLKVLTVKAGTWKVLVDETRRLARLQ